jgi:hypothetical protein
MGCSSQDCLQLNALCLFEALEKAAKEQHMAVVGASPPTSPPPEALAPSLTLPFGSSDRRLDLTATQNRPRTSSGSRLSAAPLATMSRARPDTSARSVARLSARAARVAASPGSAWSVTLPPRMHDRSAATVARSSELMPEATRAKRGNLSFGGSSSSSPSCCCACALSPPPSAGWKAAARSRSAASRVAATPSSCLALRQEPARAAWMAGRRSRTPVRGFDEG